MQVDSGSSGDPARSLPERARRFVEIIARSGSIAIAIEAARYRSTAPVVDFLRAGGRISSRTVTYGSHALPRTAFMGLSLARVAEMRRLADDGAKWIVESNASFLIELKSGPTFRATQFSLDHVMRMLCERFIEREYEPLAVQGCVVIDVGGNIGDSALYFWSQDAIHVYAYEPVSMFEVAAQENVLLNKCGDIVEFQRAGVSASESGVVEVPKLSWVGLPSTTETAPAVGIVSVLAAATQAHPGVPVVLKIDCEGCEYELLTDRLLSGRVDAVQRIMVEYHRPSPQPIVETLEGLDFDVTEVGRRHGAGMLLAVRRGV